MILSSCNHWLLFCRTGIQNEHVSLHSKAFLCCIHTPLPSEIFTKAVTMDAKAFIKDEEVHVDPQLLFQRLVTAGVRCNDLSEVFM
jgi:hypothetical protein